MENETNNKKECLFSFAKINKYYLFPFISPIFCCTANFFIHTISKGNSHMENHLFLTLYIDLSYLLGGLLFFISSIRSSTNETRYDAITFKERPSSAVKYIYNDASQKSKIKIILILLLISCLITISSVCNLYSVGKITFEKRLYFLFFIALLSKYILKNNIFKHQILSMTIAIIGLIILFIPVFLKIKKDDIFINILNVFSAFAYSLFVVMIKYLTHNYYFSPLLCLLFIGLFSIIITLSGFMAYSLIKYKDISLLNENFDFSQNKMGAKFYIYALIGMIFSTSLQVFTIYVIYYFSPILLTVTDSISPMLSWIINNIQVGLGDHPYINLIFNSTGYLIQLIAGLIYNEIIICNFCGFNESTKKILQKKENEELVSIRDTERAINNQEIDNIQDKEKIDQSVKENDSSYLSDSDDNESYKSN